MADLSRSNIVVIPRMAADDRRESTPGWMRFAAEITGYAIKQKTAGKRLAGHRHVHDVAPLPDGSFPIEDLFEASPDIFWDILPEWYVSHGVCLDFARFTARALATVRTWSDQFSPSSAGQET